MTTDTLVADGNQKKASSLAKTLRNPLVIYGMILLAGDGPLVIAYSLAKEPPQSLILLCALVLFIFGMGAFFCYLVAFKPRHLYAPTEIPEAAFGRPIFEDNEPVKRILQSAQSEVSIMEKPNLASNASAITQDLIDKIKDAGELQKAYDLLLIPGYDLSLISEILESVELKGSINADILSYARSITPSTIDTIANMMLRRGLLEKGGNAVSLTQEGKGLLNRIRIHLRPHT